MLRKKIERILQDADIDYEFYNPNEFTRFLMEFYIDGMCHFLEFTNNKEAVLTAGKEAWELNSDNYQEILDTIL